MRFFIPSLFLATFASPIMAQPQLALAEAWTHSAQRLAEQLTDGDVSLNGSQAREFQRFGRAATELAGANLPHDLQCIFRGMAEETDTQLAALSGQNAESDAVAVRRLKLMLIDAASVGKATQLVLKGAVPLSGEEANPGEHTTSCSASSPERLALQ